MFTDSKIDRLWNFANINVIYHNLTTKTFSDVVFIYGWIFVDGPLVELMNHTPKYEVIVHLCAYSNSDYYNNCNFWLIQHDLLSFVSTS